MRQRRRCDIGRARSDGRGRRHRPFAIRLFGESDRGLGRALFIVAAIGRQAVANAVESFAQTGDVPVPEYAPDAGEERFARIVVLGGQRLHHGLCSGQSDGHHAAFPLASARA